MPRKRKRSSTALTIFLLLAVVVAIAFVPVENKTKATTPQDVVVSSNDLLKVLEPQDLNSEMLEYCGFTVAFNKAMHQPNYVAWELSPEHCDGPYSRKDSEFKSDERVDGCAQLVDYRNSGFERGHMAPAADMKWSKQAMDDCHYLTNICPQNGRLNGGAWATVERSCRKWAEKYGNLYIVAGPILTDRLTRSVGETPVPVPERFFKIIIAPEANPPMGIAFLMPNGHVNGGAQQTVTTIDQIETITGYDFFSALPDDIESTIEAQHSMAAWNH